MLAATPPSSLATLGYKCHKDWAMSMRVLFRMSGSGLLSVLIVRVRVCSNFKYAFRKSVGGHADVIQRCTRYSAIELGRVYMRWFLEHGPCSDPLGTRGG